METRDIVQIALFAAIMAVLGLFPPLTVPLIGIPITCLLYTSPSPRD